MRHDATLNHMYAVKGNDKGVGKVGGLMSSESDCRLVPATRMHIHSRQTCLYTNKTKNLASL